MRAFIYWRHRDLRTLQAERVTPALEGDPFESNDTAVTRMADAEEYRVREEVKTMIDRGSWSLSLEQRA